MVVGGPQYRVGSHRQFVLMARKWALAGYPVFRFDYRGMGDSAGGCRTFESVDDDVRSAVNTLMRELPYLKGVVIFGLCDAASAALMYSATDARIAGLILANPWVRTPQGEARSFVRHYYGARLLQGSFWRKVFAGEFRLMESARGFLGSWLLAREQGQSAPRRSGGTFIDRMLAGLKEFTRPVLILISEHDLTASEFTDLCADNQAWKAAVDRPNVARHTLGGADHTFASRATLDEAVDVSIAWLAVYENQCV